METDVKVTGYNWRQLERYVSGPECLAESCWRPTTRRGDEGFDKLIHTGRFYSHKEYDVSSYFSFRSEVTDIRKMAENDAPDGFGWNFSRNV